MGVSKLPLSSPLKVNPCADGFYDRTHVNSMRVNGISKAEMNKVRSVNWLFYFDVFSKISSAFSSIPGRSPHSHAQLEVNLNWRGENKNEIEQEEIFFLVCSHLIPQNTAEFCMYACVSFKTHSDEAVLPKVRPFRPRLRSGPRGPSATGSALSHQKSLHSPRADPTLNAAQSRLLFWGPTSYSTPDHYFYIVLLNSVIPKVSCAQSP